MANGTMKTEAEYYNDTEKYTGDVGSSTNRLVIEDFYDLNSIKGHLASLYYVMVNDINLSDYDDYKFGISDKIVNNGYTNPLYIDGSGHKIQNLFIKNSSVDIFDNTDGWLKNITFENLIVMGTTGPIFNMDLIGCNIGAFLFNSSSVSIFSDKSTNSTPQTNRTDCTFNVKGVSTDGLLLKADYTRCHINIDITTTGKSIRSENKPDSTDTDYYSTLDNCYITGKYNSSDNLRSTDHYVIEYLILKNSYFAVEMTYPNFILGYTSPAVSSTVIATSTSFINKELIPYLNYTEIANFYQLTTAECQDQELLLSCGFPVISTT